MRTRNPPKLIMIVSLIMQLIMSCLVFQCSSPSRGTRPARGPRPPVRGHHRPHAFSRGLLSDTCTLHAAWSLPTASFYACVASAACCDSEAMRVPCVVRVVCTRRGVTVRDNGISVNQYFLNQQYFHITLIVTLSVMVWV